jgi:hypothetical protein
MSGVCWGLVFTEGSRLVRKKGPRKLSLHSLLNVGDAYLTIPLHTHA